MASINSPYMDNVGVTSLPPSPSQATTIAQVADDVAMVNQAYSDAMDSVTSIIPGLGNTDAQNALKALQPNIQQWISDGTNAAQNGTPPPGINGWPGWQNAGQAFISGVNQIAHIGSTATMENITQTVRSTTPEIAAIPQKVAASAGKAAGTAVAHAINASVTSLSTEAAVIAVAAIGGYFLLRALKVI